MINLKNYIIEGIFDSSLTFPDLYKGIINMFKKIKRPHMRSFFNHQFHNNLLILHHQ